MRQTTTRQSHYSRVEGGRVRAGAVTALLAVLACAAGAAPAAATFGETPGHTTKHDEDKPVGQHPEQGGPDERLGWALALGGAGLGGAGLVAFAISRGAFPRMRAALVTGFFARLTRHDVTRHPLRLRILDAVRDRPGVTAAELAGRHEINTGTLNYHLGVLERAGELRSMRVGRNRLIFPAGYAVDEAALAALEAQTRRELTVMVLQSPGLAASQLAARLGLRRATVHHHLARLEAAGLVRLERGARTRCYPTSRLHAVVAERRPRRIAVVSDEEHRNA